MKTRNIFLSAIAAIAMASCCSSKTDTKQMLVTDSVSFEKKDSIAEVSIYADFPTTAPQSIKTAISEYIIEFLGAEYMGSLENGDSIVNYYGRKEYNYLVNEFKETEGETPLMVDHKFNKIRETRKYVTYVAVNDVYMGGAHGFSIVQGATFRKADGRKFNNDMLVGVYKDEFRALLKKGLKEYFGMPKMTDDDLKKLLILNDPYDVDFLPLPQNPPYITAKGLTFVYQQYEIAAYAAGLPSFTIPFDEIKPYLTSTVLKMLE